MSESGHFQESHINTQPNLTQAVITLVQTDIY